MKLLQWIADSEKYFKLIMLLIVLACCCGVPAYTLVTGR